MKFWRKNNGDCGTMDDNGFVPDSIEITEQKYQNWVLEHTTPDSPHESDIEKIIKFAKKEGWIK